MDDENLNETSTSTETQLENTVETEEVEGLQKKSNPDEGKSPETKTEEKTDEVVPENYDFKDVKLPEGMELDKELTEEFSIAAKEMGLTQAKADKFMGMGVKLTSKIQGKFQEAMKEAQVNQIKAYKTMLNTDPEIGGANLKTTLTEANAAYEVFVSDEAANILSATGLNNHPAIVKMFRDIGRQVKNDTIKGGANTKHVRTAEDWYPEMKKG